MALQISKPTQYGVDATYWKLESCTINYTSETVVATFAGYLDAEARFTHQPIAQHVVAFDAVSFPFDPQADENVPTVLYNSAKQGDFFAGALDV